MSAKAYSHQEMAEAIALATIVGAEEASRQLGMQTRTIRKWCERAGRAPADAIRGDDWASIGALARSQVAARLAAGKVTPVQAATIAGIAQRNALTVQELPPESAVAALDSFCDWSVGEGYVTDEADLDGFDALQRELIRRANAEPGQPHRPAMLAWFSKRPDIPADDLPTWVQAQTTALIAEHGSLAALREWEVRRRAEDHAAMVAQLDRNRQAAEDWQRRALNAETQALLEAAEQWLVEHSGADA